MKTNATSQPTIRSIVSNSRRFLGKLLGVSICGLFVSLSPAPALAAGPDGTYSLAKASGSLTIAGETMKLDDNMVKELGALKNGRIVINGNKLQLNRKSAADIIGKLGKELGLKFNVKITGPSNVPLRKSGKTWVGATTTPITVNASTTFEGRKISATIKTHFKVKVQGDDLKLTIPVSGKALGKNLKGTLNIVCSR